jgi:murein DD-endopeptidase MepM/ murein hydrolase activator NlpD
MYKKLLFALLTIVLLMPGMAVRAQESTPSTGPIYIIQPGDSLSSIASRFGISLTDLMAANNIADANNIAVGAQVVIPGLEGISGVLITEYVGYGDTMRSLSRRNQVSEGFLRKLNHVTSPAELYAGVGLVLPQKDNFTPLARRAVLAQGESLLEAAVREGSDPWTLSQTNSLNGTWDALAGDILYLPSGNADAAEPNGMPSAFTTVTVGPLPMTQGGTEKIVIQTQAGVTLGGTLVDMPLHFFPQEDGSFVALQGISAILDPGPYPLKLEATLPDGSKQSYEQMVIVQSGNYPTDVLLVVDPALIDPAVTAPELEWLTKTTAPATPTKYWKGLFQGPGSFPDCFTSRYGYSRTYQGKGTNLEITSWHTGLDFCGGAGLPIAAPADGVVIFAGPLTVRGNATIIDHGWGVYSGIWHQSEIKVQVGQTVKKGDVIGLVGGTGRVTGAHLHWEVWVNGIQVNPMAWLENVYP